jgi:hypothetical protein
MRNARRTLARWRVAAAVLSLAAGGCAPRDPLDTRVSADTYTSFSIFMAKIGERLGPEGTKDLNEAVQEFRFRVMAEGKASGSDAVDEAMRQAIDGRTVGEVLRGGLGRELTRLEAERDQLRKSMAENALMRTRPGDHDSANYLTDLRQRQEVRLQAVSDGIARTRKKLAALPPAGP